MEKRTENSTFKPLSTNIVPYLKIQVEGGMAPTADAHGGTFQISTGLTI